MARRRWGNTPSDGILVELKGAVMVVVVVVVLFAAGRRSCLLRPRDWWNKVRRHAKGKNRLSCIAAGGILDAVALVWDSLPELEGLQNTRMFCA